MNPICREILFQLMLLLVGLLGMTYRIGTASRNAAADAIADLIDVGGTGTIRIRTSTQPTNVGDSDSGTLLGTLTFSATAFGAASSGVVTASTITSDTTADASGTATQFRIYTGGGTAHSDGTCGTSGTDMVFDNNVIVAGGVIACSSFTITVPIS